MFSGQGSHYHQMGKELWERNRVFRDTMQRLDRLGQALMGVSVVDAIYSRSVSDTFDRITLTHPAIFMVEYSLAQCLLEAGVAPDMTLGASLGSFAAAAMAGVLLVEDAMTAVINQARTVEANCERGGMIAVLADPALFSDMGLGARSELAGVNFSSHFAVSAPESNLSDIEATLRLRKLVYQRLAVSFAFHSRWIDSARQPYEAFLQSLRQRPTRLPMVCCEQAGMLSEVPADYFWRIARGPVRFRDTIAQLERHDAYRYIDVGPSGTLATFVKYGLAATSRSTVHALLTPYGQNLKNLEALRQSS
jgi:acyl transferase domain-containing protein